MTDKKTSIELEDDQFALVFDGSGNLIEVYIPNSDESDVPDNIVEIIQNATANTIH